MCKVKYYNNLLFYKGIYFSVELLLSLPVFLNILLPVIQPDGFH